jgi:hypothetical protein
MLSSPARSAARMSPASRPGGAVAKGARIALATLAALTFLGASACDLEVNAHADVSLAGSHTLHVTYRSAAPSSGRAPSHP